MTAQPWKEPYHDRRKHERNFGKLTVQGIFIMEKKKEFATALFGLVAVALAAGFLMYIEWCGYNDKMEILHVALEQEHEGEELIDTVAGLLKGQPWTDTKSAEQELEQYGYRPSYRNQYKKKLYQDWVRTAVVFELLYLGFLASLYLGKKRRMADRRGELLWLESRITKMRDLPDEESGGGIARDGESGRGIAKAEESGKEMALIGEYSGWLALDEEYDEDMGRLLMGLGALCDSLQLLRRQARAEKEETKALVTDISHQLKTPVAAFKTSFEILQSENLEEAQKQEFLGRCSIQMQRLEELVSALINISRMETGMIEIKREEKNLFDTLLLAVSRIYPKAWEKGIEVELEAEEPLREIAVSHDVRWMCEAFLNVLENAVKYSKSQTKVTIRMIRVNVFLRIEIEDAGIGIPKNEWNQIFKRFYRGAAKEVQEAPGSGVGLYLAREIVARQGGTLAVASPRGGKCGSCFVFQLPFIYTHERYSIIDWQ